MSSLRHLASLAALGTFALLAVASGGKAKDDSGNSTAKPTGATVSATGAATAAATGKADSPLSLGSKVTFKNPAIPDFELVMDAPEGAKAENKFTNTVITAGDRFQIMVSQGNQNLAEAKKTMQSSTAILKAESFEIDTKDTLLFEGEDMGTKGYHFIHNVKAGPGEFFKCTEWRKPSATYTKADAELMLEACKSLKGAGAEAAAKPAAPAKDAKKK